MDGDKGRTDIRIRIRVGDVVKLARWVPKQVTSPHAIYAKKAPVDHPLYDLKWKLINIDLETRSRALASQRHSQVFPS